MPTVYVPPLLRDLTGGDDVLEVEGQNVREAIERLDARFPGLRDRLCRGNQLAPGLSVTVDGRVSSLGLIQKLEPTSEVHFLPAIGGG